MATRGLKLFSQEKDSLEKGQRLQKISLKKKKGSLSLSLLKIFDDKEFSRDS